MQHGGIEKSHEAVTGEDIKASLRFQQNQHVDFLPNSLLAPGSGSWNTFSSPTGLIGFTKKQNKC